MAEPILQIVDGSFSHGGAPSGFVRTNVKIWQGETVILLGANGSGKSTLLRILAGLQFLQKGQCLAWGQEVSLSSLRTDFGIRYRKEVGILFQNSDAQLFCPTVREEIAFGPRQLGLAESSIAGIVQDQAQLLGITRLLDRPPFALSGGEKRKVAIAAILAVEPSVLLLDEPTAGLDPRSSRVLIDQFLAYREQGKTIVMATHDLHFVSELASRIVVISEEQTILAQGGPADILSNESLLRAANLVHLHRYQRGEGGRSHEHAHT